MRQDRSPSLGKRKSRTLSRTYLGSDTEERKRTRLTTNPRKQKTSHPPGSRGFNRHVPSIPQPKAPTENREPDTTGKTYAHLVITYRMQTRARETHVPRHQRRGEEDKMRGQRPRLVWCYVPFSIVDQPGGRLSVSLLVTLRSPCRFGLPL